MNRFYVLLIGVVCASCVHSRYYSFPVQEIGATLVLEENNSNAQRVFLCNKLGAIDFDYLLSRSTELFVNKNSGNALMLDVFLSPSEYSSEIILVNKQPGLYIIPYNCFVLNDMRDNGELDDQPHITLSFPFTNDNLLIYKRPDGKKTFCRAQDSTALAESVFNKQAQDRGRARKYLHELPLFFARERLSGSSLQIDVEPLEEGNGFRYCGIRVETEVPFGELGELSFYIDPLLPNYLFNDKINYLNWPQQIFVYIIQHFVESFIRFFFVLYLVINIIVDRR